MISTLILSLPITKLASGGSKSKKFKSTKAIVISILDRG